MGGKITGAIAAIAVSSASASIVGAIYTGLVSGGFDYSSALGLVGGADRAPAVAAFVVDANKNK